MLPREFEPIEGEEVQAREQDVKPRFEHRLWSAYYCTTLIEDFYKKVIKKNLFAGNFIARNLPSLSPRCHYPSK